MSLVGSLEDLGLGDILQIISLSRKSGVLMLRSERGEGRIIFRDGLIHGAFRKGDPTGLRELVAGLGTVPKAELEDAFEQARDQGVSLAAVLVGRSLISAESLEELRRETVEKAVRQMFRWSSGEFSFEVRDAIPDREIFSSSGVNPQYLALDFTRIVDENGCEADEDPSCDSLVFDGEGDSGSDSETPGVAEEPIASDETSSLTRDGKVAAPEQASPAQQAIVTIEDISPVGEPIVAAEAIADLELLEATEEVTGAAPPSCATTR